MTAQSRVWLALAACMALSFLIYAPSIKAPFFFDDETNFIDNPDIRKLENLKTRLVFKMEKMAQNTNVPTRAITFLTFTLEYALWGKNPSGYRVVNIALHGLAAFLLFLLLREILARWNLGEYLFGVALAGAMLFCAHPMQGDAVAYISNRSDVLAALFSLLALVLFSRAGPDRGRAAARLVFANFAFAAAILSKETAATFPLILLGYDYFIAANRDGAALRNRWRRHAPFWGTLALYMIYRRALMGDLMYQWALQEDSWTSMEYLSMQVMAIPKYLRLLLAPVGQCIDHILLPPDSWLEPRMLVAFAAWAAILALAAFLIRGTWKAKSTAALFSSACFGMLWFFAGLAPSSSVFPIFDAMVERRVYWPSGGWVLGVLAFYAWLFDATENGPVNGANHSKKIIVFLSVHTAILALFTLHRSTLYGHPERLWIEAVARYPGNPRAYVNLGSYIEKKNPAKAVELGRMALSLNPKYAVAQNNLGNALYALNDVEGAVASYQKAIELKPGWVQPYINLAGMHYHARRLKEAEAMYLKALALETGYALVYNNLGSIYFERGETEMAVDFYNKAIETDAGYGLAYYNLALVLVARKQFDLALKAMVSARALLPDNPAVENNLRALQAMKP